MKAFTLNHKRYVQSIYSKHSPIVIGVGPAGCGKTYIACTTAIQQLLKKDVSKIIITRPTANVDEEHGFLPGSIEDKMEPYLNPIYDCFLESISKQQLKKYLSDDTINICPLGFMRGRTFNNAIIIADETQNTTKMQMKMLLTRIGRESKMVITGDVDQSDIGCENGLQDILKKIDNQFNEKDESIIDVIEFEQPDILRNEIVMKVLDLYKYY